MKAHDQLEPTIFVIFGGAGDLAWRKLMPAMFDLSQDRSLPDYFSIIAIDRVAMSDEKIRRRLHDGVKKFSRQPTVKTYRMDQNFLNIFTTSKAISKNCKPIEI